MNFNKNLILLQVMSLASALVIYLIDHSASQYGKGLKQSQEQKAVKTPKTVKTAAKMRKLRNTAYFPAPLLSLHHLLYFLKKLHPNNKNLKQNLSSLFFPLLKLKSRYYFYLP